MEGGTSTESPDIFIVRRGHFTALCPLEGILHHVLQCVNGENASLNKEANWTILMPVYTIKPDYFLHKYTIQ